MYTEKSERDCARGHNGAGSRKSNTPHAEPVAEMKPVDRARAKRKKKKKEKKKLASKKGKGRNVSITLSENDETFYITSQAQGELVWKAPNVLL